HYAERLHWWGEINNIKNLVNKNFDGGYLTNVSGIPLGWSNSGSSGGSVNIVAASPNTLGFACNLTSAGGLNDAMISQSAYQDYFGGPIFQAGLPYTFRVLASVSGTKTGNLVAEIYSPSSGSLAIATIPVSSLTSTQAWYCANFNVAMPA